MGKIQPRSLKGFRDFLPKEARKRQYVVDILKSVFESFGFEPLETPALEYEEILLGKYGDEGDRLMYRFEDNGKRRVALRYDQTVPLARVIAQYQNDLAMPFKRYQIQNVWRGENPQKGRFREFLQCDADIVGTSSLLSDAEIIATADKSLKKLGFKKFRILINDRSIFSESEQFGSLPEKELPIVVRAIDKLKKIGEEKVLEELISNGIENSKASFILQSIKENKPTSTVQECFQILKKIGIDKDKVEFLPTLVRGLDYYTGIIFEIEIEGYDAGSVAGGGRYDDLIGMFTGKKIPAVGIAFGINRLIEAMEEFNLFPKDLTITKIIVSISEASKEKSIQICQRIREENINAEIYLDENAPLEKQLKYADRRKIPYFLIVKDDNLELKDMRKREQKTLTFEEILEILR